MEGELRKRYEADYRVVCEGLPEAALEKLRGYEQSGEEVALVLAAQWMAGTTGVGFLVRTHQVFPTAERLLLIDMGDSDSGRVIPRAMTLGRIDYFEAKPGPPPNERFHEVVTDLLREWTKPYRSAVNAMAKVVGKRWSRRSHEARDLLKRHNIPYAFYAADSEAGRALLGEVGAADRLPVWVLFDGQATMHLSNYASSVMLLVRGGSLEASMSDYLIREIEVSTNVEVRLNTRVVGGVTSPHCTRRALPSSCPASPPKQIEHEDGRSYQHEDT